MIDHFDSGTTFSLKLSNETLQLLESGAMDWNETYYKDEVGLWQRCILQRAVTPKKDYCVCLFTDDEMFQLIDEGKIKFDEDRKSAPTRFGESQEMEGIHNISLEEGLEALEAAKQATELY